MNHSESSIRIYHTKDYARFRMITGNRQLNELKIKRIISDIETGLDVLRYCPVLVKENVDGQTLDIIDGQHRFYVSKKMKCGVWYIIAEDMNLMEIAKINSNTEKWKDNDFINCYVQLGNEHYKTLQSFIDTYAFPIGVSITMLTRGYLVGEGSTTTLTKEKFRKGEFVVVEYNKAIHLAEQIKLFSKFPAHTTGAFVEAIGRIIKSDKIKIMDLVRKFDKDPLQLTSRKNAKEYLLLLEQIYNYGKASRTIIF